VSALQTDDSTVDVLDANDIDDSDNYFGILLDLCRGDSIEVTSSNVSSLLKLCEFLENAEFGSALINFAVEGERILISNVLDRIELKWRHSCDFSTEIEFIASRLSEFDVESLNRLDVTIIDEIIRSDSLRIDHEDFLLDLLFSLGHSTLFGRVQCIFLSISGIDRLLEWISGHSIDSLLWSSLCFRLRCKLDLTELRSISHRFSHRFSRIFGFEGAPFSGILSHLSSVCGGNVHKHGIVTITSSSTSSNSVNCWQVADFTWTGSWRSQNEAGSWICFDFKERRVQLQHYSLKGEDGGGCYPADWVIEGSNDGLTWTVVDERHTDSLLGSGRVDTFPCSGSTDGDGYHRLRWRMTDKGKSCPGEDRCCHVAKLSHIEFFGVLYSATPFRTS
jgi:hypothetical protein